MPSSCGASPPTSSVRSGGVSEAATATAPPSPSAAAAATVTAPPLVPVISDSARVAATASPVTAHSAASAASAGPPLSAACASPSGSVGGVVLTGSAASTGSYASQQSQMLDLVKGASSSLHAHADASECDKARGRLLVHFLTQVQTSGYQSLWRFNLTDCVNIAHTLTQVGERFATGSLLLRGLLVVHAALLFELQLETRSPPSDPEDHLSDDVNQGRFQQHVDALDQNKHVAERAYHKRQ